MLGRVLSGWFWRWSLVVECGVFGGEEDGRRLVCSVSGLVLECSRKSDQHCELYDSVNHLKVERILLLGFLKKKKKRMFSGCESSSEV